jgi:transporter family-2 protein
MLYIYFFISILAGVSIVVARIINSNLAEKIGIFQGTFFNYITGLLFSFIFLLLSSESPKISNINLTSIPLWAYLGGLTGVLVIVLSNYVTPKISAFYFTLLIFIGQLLVGIVIDYLTLNMLSMGKVIGGLFVLIGLTFNLLMDKRKKNNLSLTAQDSN